MDATLENKIERAFKKCLEEIAKEYRQSLRRFRPYPKVATGELSNIDAKKDVSIEITDTEAVGYLTLAPHWKNVETGRKPGLKQPPVSVIQKWIEDRRIKPKDNISKKSLAYLIARGIGRNGIPATNMLQTVTREVTAKHRENIETAGAEALLSVLEDYFNIDNNKN